MKNYICILLTVVLFYGCNTSSEKKKISDDSLQYYPPTPQTLDRNEFRHYFRELSVFFDTTLLNKNFNGGILVAKNGAIVYEKYYGLVDLRKKDSLTDSTSLHIASTSKTFTAVAVLRLVQEDKLSLDDSLSKFFPGFPYPGITIRMLLDHRSGLPNYLYFMSNNKWGILPNGRWNRQFATNADVLQMMYDKRPDRVSSPDSRFTYCNTNYMLLALIIEKVTGMSFPDYMQQKFFGPLQMKDTYIFTLKDTLTASPSFTNNGTYWNNDFLDGTYGDKNVYTTPRDLLKWDQALYTDQVINKSLLDSAFAPHSFEKASVHNYGFGWRLQILPNGKKVIYHFGKWHGSNAAFARLTDEKATIIIIGNRFTSSIYNTAHLCYNIFGDYAQRSYNEPEEADSLKASGPQARQKAPLKKTRH